MPWGCLYLIINDVQLYIIYYWGYLFRSRQTLSCLWDPKWRGKKSAFPTNSRPISLTAYLKVNEETGQSSSWQWFNFHFTVWASSQSITLCISGGLSCIAHRQPIYVVFFSITEAYYICGNTLYWLPCMRQEFANLSYLFKSKLVILSLIPSNRI